MRKIYFTILILAAECMTCSAEDEVHISTAAGLREISANVLSGTSYSNTVIYLDNDIDLAGNSWSPIGTEGHPFEGTFDGQGHRVKNLSYSTTELISGVGLFGVVTGTTTIRNVILDSSCTISFTYTSYTTKSTGTAGLVGCYKGKDNCSSYILTIDNCGNEATVTGQYYTAGVFGMVDTDIESSARIYINNCYNTGTISGKEGNTAGFITGPDNKNVSIFNTWALATISGYSSSCPFASNASGCSYTHCYMAHDTNHPYTQTGVGAEASESTMQKEAFIKSLNSSISSSSTPSAYTTWVYDGQPNTHPYYRNDSQRAIPIVKLNAQGFATYSCVKSSYIELQTSGVKMYKATVSGTTITLTELTGVIPSGTGFIIYGGTEMAGQEVEFVQTSFGTAADVTGNELLPTTTYEANPVAVPTTGYNYVMGSDGQFHPYSGATFASNRAYFNFTTDPLANSGAKFSVVFDDGTPTAVDNIDVDVDAGTGKIYNISGQQVGSNYKGIVIVNGKKIVND